MVAGMIDKDLADHLGPHREFITTASGELRNPGIITIERTKIRILQRKQTSRPTRKIKTLSAEPPANLLNCASGTTTPTATL